MAAIDQCRIKNDKKDRNTAADKTGQTAAGDQLKEKIIKNRAKFTHTETLIRRRHH